MIVMVWAVISVLPYGKNMKLGLDLQGGMHVVLGVDTEKAVEGRLESFAVKIRKELAAESVNFGYVQMDDRGRINIALNNTDDAEKVKKIISDRYDTLESVASSGSNILSYRFNNAAVKQIKEYAVDQSLEVVRNRIDQFGVTEPVIQRQGQNQVVVQLPGITEPERAISLIGRTAQLKFHIVNETVNPEDAVRGNIPLTQFFFIRKPQIKTPARCSAVFPLFLKERLCSPETTLWTLPFPSRRTTFPQFSSRWTQPEASCLKRLQVRT
ncbi:MAG: hypothetical protein LRY51_11955 [Geovibrio sp.]|nr:hypothetical protein [Geovibrio sp.]